jgi:hypothetical protein
MLIQDALSCAPAPPPAPTDEDYLMVFSAFQLVLSRQDLS